MEAPRGVENTASETILHKLRERVKELTALHRTARLLQDHRRPALELLGAVVRLLPDAWQYPEVAAARIRFQGGEIATDRFRETEWSQCADFATCGGVEGSITVVYLEERPEADEGPFLAEERELIDSLAEMLRSHLEHLAADAALRAAHDSLEAQVTERTADLRRLASRLTLAEEKERRRIASDLHDHVGQALAFIKMRVREFQGNAVFGGFDQEIGDTLRLLDQTIQYTRELTGTISPPVLYELGLEPALDWLAERFTAKHRFRVRLRTSGEPQHVPEELAVMLFISARELLINSLKHSGVAEADLDLCWEESGLRLGVTDEGCEVGEVATTARHGDRFGLFSIRERFRDLGGAVEVDSRPGEGCRVTIRVPLPGEETS